MTKVSNHQKTGGLDRPFDFTSFSAKPCFISWLLLFTPGVFLVRFHLFFDPLGLRLDSSMTSYSKSPF